MIASARFRQPALILAPARIEQKDTQLRSIDYEDIYFSYDGAAETERVFIEPMRLRELFEHGSEGGVRLGELGFGTGLNFLAVSEAFLKVAPESARLDYIAFEKHPLRCSDLKQILKRHASKMTLAEALIDAWPQRFVGWHVRYFAKDRIRLLLYQGDALDGVTDLRGKCHAWLLDGFDARRNPEMWSEQLFKHIAEKSEADARIASFTAQGDVRRRLESVGFAITRVDQQPHKRHSLAGRRISGLATRATRLREVAIIGAGFAGTFTAHLLAIRGVSVHLFDPQFEPIPVALAHVRLGDPNLPHMQLRALHSPEPLAWSVPYGRASTASFFAEPSPRHTAHDQHRFFSREWWQLDADLGYRCQPYVRKSGRLCGLGQPFATPCIRA